LIPREEAVFQADRNVAPVTTKSAKKLSHEQLLQTESKRCSSDNKIGQKVVTRATLPNGSEMRSTRKEQRREEAAGLEPVASSANLLNLARKPSCEASKKA
jgi:hypothetical protein